MRTSQRWSVVGALVAGLLLGQCFGPAVAWAADRMEINWPSVFRFEANRTIPMEIERPVEVKVDRYNLPEIKVNVQELPAVRVTGGSTTSVATAPSFAPLHTANGTTIFVAGRANGTAAVMRYDHATGRVTRVSGFEF